jgi:putative transposase
MLNDLAHVPRGDQAMVAAALRTIYAQPSQEAARRQLRAVYDAMLPHWLKAAQILSEAEYDILAYMSFPVEQYKKLTCECKRLINM